MPSERARAGYVLACCAYATQRGHPGILNMLQIAHSSPCRAGPPPHQDVFDAMKLRAASRQKVLVDSRLRDAWPAAQGGQSASPWACAPARRVVRFPLPGDYRDVRLYRGGAEPVGRRHATRLVHRRGRATREAGFPIELVPMRAWLARIRLNADEQMRFVHDSLRGCQPVQHGEQGACSLGQVTEACAGWTASSTAHAGDDEARHLEVSCAISRASSASSTGERQPVHDHGRADARLALDMKFLGMQIMIEGSRSAPSA